jgi:DNA (cytosine-5)-methyltransferase 1
MEMANGKGRDAMKYLSLFSGIEAASVAWEPLGWEPMAFAEIEPFPCAVLAERFPYVPNLGDVSKIDWSAFVEEHGRPDVLIGGSPCQSFSVAGLRKGMADPRGNLMLEYLRAVDETNPKWVIWENVPGVLSADGGRAFGTLLGALVEIGYGFAYRVLDAQFYGVAQRRRRVFVVGCLGDWRGAASVLFERESLRWDSPSSREKRKSLTAAASGRTKVLPINTMIATRGGKLGEGTGFGIGKTEKRNSLLQQGINTLSMC